MNSLRALVFFALLFSVRDLSAAALDVTVKDTKGAPVPDAVIYATGRGAGPKTAPPQTVIDQRDKQFIPYVTALQVGTAVWFANTDNIRHHVYSFSPAKKFELPLYAGVPAAPVTFDKAGFVTLGCNIHDWMIAYVAVLTTPYFAVTEKEGRARLMKLPAGRYNIAAWHPALKDPPERVAQQITLTAEGGQTLSFTLDLKPALRAQRAPGLSTGGYP